MLPLLVSITGGCKCSDEKEAFSKADVATASNTGAESDAASDSAITEKEALKIAQEDASRAYRDLSPYAVTAKFEGGTWYVDYNLICKTCAGGGPHYVISGTDGTILKKRYEQ